MTTILTGDSREKLKELEDESIDALVTDPPYLINFMGKDWDKENSPAGDSSFWEEVLRVMKPGAHGLVFGHSRQHHRVMTALEDAGFEIRDCLMWLYGQGFPKSHNIGKAVEKLNGTVKVKGKKKGAGSTGNTYVSNNTDYVGGDKGVYKKEYDEIEITNEWEGWGTALKPCYEPIIMVRKPLAKKHTIAKNVLAYGVGGINIDASRIGTSEDFSNVKPRKMMANQGSVKTDDHDHTAAESWQQAKDKLQNLGRFPANVLLSHHPDCKQVGEVEDTRSGGERTKTIFSEKEPVSGGEGTGGTMKATTTRKVYECADDCAVKILDEQSGITKGSGKATIAQAGLCADGIGKHDGRKTMPKAKEGLMTKRNVGDSGGASRFFYCAEVGEEERNAAYEPIIMVRKPIEKKLTIAKNVLKHGVGGINIDASRIGTDEIKVQQVIPNSAAHFGGAKLNGITTSHTGRFPANVLLDEVSAKILDEQAPKTGNGHAPKTKVTGYGKNYGGTTTYEGAGKRLGGLAGASRFFYCAKVGKKERNAGSTKNTHPTVKPIKLMTYLTKLITPPNGKVLDPFMGSGSTGMACAMQGFDFVGIDMDPDYVEISKARIEWARTQKEND